VERKRVLVIGRSGQLARCLADEASGWSGLDMTFASHQQCNIGSGLQTEEMIGAEDPDAVINTCAFHDLTACETDFDTAFRVNALGVANLLSAIPEGCHLYHLSTDYVFDGCVGDMQNEAVKYCVTCRPSPINNYGRTKRAGEIIALLPGRATVIRTASLFSKYGSTGKGGSNFLLGMLRRATEPEPSPIAVDSDVVMSPTYTPWLARAILHMIDTDQKPDIAHLVCDDPPVSWHDFAKAIFEIGSDPALNPIGETVPLFREALSRLVPRQSDPWPPRPKFSALERSPASIVLGDWRSALEHFFLNVWPRIQEAQP